MAEARLARAEVERLGAKYGPTDPWIRMLCANLLAAMDEIERLRTRWCDDWQPEAALSRVRKEPSDG